MTTALLSSNALTHTHTPWGSRDARGFAVGQSSVSLEGDGIRVMVGSGVCYERCGGGGQG